MQALTLVTWNIHRGRGRDGRIDPVRVADAIAADIAPVAPDVLALQEADDESDRQFGVLDVEALERAIGLKRLAGLEWGSESHGFQGNVLFLAPHLVVTSAQPIDLPGVWPRGAVAVDFETPRLRLIATHLSLSQALRAAQIRTLGQFHARRPAMPLVIVGDMNEWRPWNGLAFSRRVSGVELGGPARRTFPSRQPLLPLDRILCDPSGQLSDVRSLDTHRLRAASDHLPLTGRLALKSAATSG